MSSRERRRLIVFSQVKQGAISVAEATRSLGLSVRQGRRLWKRYREKGDSGVVHGLRGKKGNAGQEALRAKVLALYRQKYAACNVSHAATLMLEKQKLVISRKTLWRWLKAEGLIAQPRRHKKHRQRRERRRSTGELLQMDGSTHRWLGEALPYYVLFVMIDDATGQVFARFYESEDTASAFDLFGRYVRGHGLPLALYVDHDSIYVVNESEAQAQRRQVAGKPAQTQFGRAMEELSVEIITANSPQAKGRVERVNRTLQDRLVKELAMAGVRDIEAANAFLEKTFLKAFNREFGKVPASGANVHHKVASHVKLEDVLCHKEIRTVGEDWCLQYESRILQIRKNHESLALAGKRVEVIQPADGILKLRYRRHSLNFVELATRPVNMPLPKPRPPVHTPQKPPAGHPWKQSYKGMGRRVSISTGQPRGEKFRGVVKAVPFHSDSLRSPRSIPHP